MAGEIEKLQILGSYGLKVKKVYPAFTFPAPDGYTYHLRTGDRRGLKSWSLTYDSLHSDPNSDCLVTLEDGTQQTYFEYYWRFFDRHHDPEIKPFLITCPEDGQDYTVVFGVNEREMEFSTYQLWRSGISIIQIRLGELGLGELGEVSQNNPQEI